MRMLSILGAALACAVLACALYAANGKKQTQGGTADPPTPPAKPTLPQGTPAEQVEALIKQHEQAMANLRKLAEAAKTEEEEEKLFAFFPDPDHYAALLLQIAQEHPSDTAAVDALIWVVRNTHSRPNQADSPYAKARAMLVRDHLASPKIGPFCRSLMYAEYDPEAVSLLRQVLEKHGDKQVQAQAAFGLAKLLQRRAAAAKFVQNPANEKELAAYTKSYGAEGIADLKRSDPEGQRKEAEALLERLTQDKDYAATKVTRGESTFTLGAMAGHELFQLRYLIPGKAAPDIIGEDVDGKPLKLSDFRGKVVVLVFCGHWCGPCRGLYPLERALVEKHQGRPFTIVGVNSDSDREKVKAVAAAEKLTWPVFWDAGSPNGPIQRQWNIWGYPTLYLIDHQGVIVRQISLSPADDALIESNIKSAEAAAQR
jgi:peroxiredoxin